MTSFSPLFSRFCLQLFSSCHPQCVGKPVLIAAPPARRRDFAALVPRPQSGFAAAPTYAIHLTSTNLARSDSTSFFARIFQNCVLRYELTCWILSANQSCLSLSPLPVRPHLLKIARRRRTMEKRDGASKMRRKEEPSRDSPRDYVSVSRSQQVTAGELPTSIANKSWYRRYHLTTAVLHIASLATQQVSRLLPS